MPASMAPSIMAATWSSTRMIQGWRHWKPAPPEACLPQPPPYTRTIKSAGRAMKHAAGLCLGLFLTLTQSAAAQLPKDLSQVRGFNYFPVSVTNEQIFQQYDDAEVNRDFGYARSLGLNQVR